VGYAVVTLNVRHFQAIAGLTVLLNGGSGEKKRLHR